MIEQRPERTEQIEVVPESPRTDRDETGGSGDGGRLLAVGRALFGSVLAFMALDNLRNLEGRIQYAESKGAPFPAVSVPLISSSLLVGSIGVALWRVPVAAASAMAAFFLSVTPLMHDFWAIDDEQEAQEQQIHFLKNSALLGATIAFLGLGKRRER